MTDLLESALAKARTLPRAEQDELAHAILMLLEEDNAVVQLSPEQEASFAEALSQADRGEFASAADVDAVLAKARG